MKKRLPVIIITFCVSFISLVVLSLFSMERFATYVSYSDMTDHTNMIIKSIYSVESYLKDLDRSERGYMLTRDTVYLRYFSDARDSLYASLSQLSDINKNNPDELHKVAMVKSSVALRVIAARNNENYVDTAGTSTPSAYYYEGRKYMMDVAGKLRDLHEAENRLLARRYEAEAFYEHLTTNTLRLLLVFFCVVTLVLFFVLVNELRARIRYQGALHTKMMDLERSHNELKEIAFAASHDMQEPLRKIQVFSDKLLYRKSGGMEEETEKILRRINGAAGRMQELINALANLTELIIPQEMKKRVDLDNTLHYLLQDMDEKITTKNAKVTVHSLPAVQGYPNQLRILFTALLDNSLKFTREGVQPEINISAEVMNGYELLDINPELADRKFYRITCSDNGIGFDNQFITKIFRIFQRLHPNSSEYEGKGIGLAICRRVMDNHNGYIIAHSQHGAGAKFKLFFPAEVINAYG